MRDEIASIWVRTWMLILLGPVMLGASACGDDDSVGVPDAGARDQVSDAGENHRLATVSIIDAGFEYPDSGMTCGLNLGLRCDGDEDCGGGQVCCGTFDQVTFTYTSVECSDACGDANQRTLCHPGDACPNVDYVCRRSSLLPFDFVSVCSMPAIDLPEQVGDAVEGEIHCGTASCAVGAEQCCLGARVSRQPPISVEPFEPYCAPAGESCTCDNTASPPPVDAGGDGG